MSFQIRSFMKENRDYPFFFLNDFGFLSGEEVAYLIFYLSDMIIDRQEQEIIISGGDSSVNLIIIMTYIFRGYHPVLSFKESSDDFRSDFSDLDSRKCYDIVREYRRNRPSQEKKNDMILAIEKQLIKARIGFSTSGTGGTRKIIWKSWEQLRRESVNLKNLYQIPERSTVVTLVNPLHLYGFIHSLVLPMCAALCSVVSVCRMGLYPGLFGLKKVNLLCASPGLWTQVRELIDYYKISTLVTSGSAPGRTMTDEILQKFYNKLKCYDIIGSTETGGIGYRDLMNSENNFQYHQFKGVFLWRENGATYIKSPYLKQSSLRLEDDLEPLIPGSVFLYHGRKDRIYKYCGKRYSLDEQETILRKLLPGRKVHCAFKEEPDRIKGGILVAMSEGPEESVSCLRYEWKQICTLPFPEELRFFSKIPIDSMGKPDFRQIFEVSKENVTA